MMKPLKKCILPIVLISPIVCLPAVHLQSTKKYETCVVITNTADQQQALLPFAKLTSFAVVNIHFKRNTIKKPNKKATVTCYLHGLGKFFHYL